MQRKQIPGLRVVVFISVSQQLQPPSFTPTMSSTSTKSQRVAPLLSGDEARYRREFIHCEPHANNLGRYRALKELVNELSDVSCKVAEVGCGSYDLKERQMAGVHLLCFLWVSSLALCTLSLPSDQS